MLLKKISVLLAVLFASQLAHAVEYYELEVYGYDLASKHELEVENSTSMSSDDASDFENKIMRSTFEFNYGLNDRWEATAYLDYTIPSQDHAEYTAFRTHARTNFFEKGEMPVDMGFYMEAELPRDYRAKDVGLELRPIFEKDISRWVLRFNPAVEFSHVGTYTGSNTQVIDPDDSRVLSSSSQTLTGDKVWLVQYSINASVGYGFNDYCRPHVDWFQGLTDNSALLMPAMDFRIGKGLKGSVGVGFGQNSNTESRLITTRLEYEAFL